MRKLPVIVIRWIDKSRDPLYLGFNKLWVQGNTLRVIIDKNEDGTNRFVTYDTRLITFEVRNLYDEEQIYRCEHCDRV